MMRSKQMFHISHYVPHRSLASCDVVVYCAVLHHLAEDNFRDFPASINAQTCISHHTHHRPDHDDPSGELHDL